MRACVRACVCECEYVWVSSSIPCVLKETSVDSSWHAEWYQLATVVFLVSWNTLCSYCIEGNYFNKWGTVNIHCVQPIQKTKSNGKTRGTKAFRFRKVLKVLVFRVVMPALVSAWKTAQCFDGKHDTVLSAVLCFQISTKNNWNFLFVRKFWTDGRVQLKCDRHTLSHGRGSEGETGEWSG